MNKLPTALQPVLVIREVQEDGTVAEARLYLDAWVGLFIDDCVVGGYHSTPVPIPAETL
jgi:hypothetical protein